MPLTTFLSISDVPGDASLVTGCSDSNIQRLKCVARAQWVFRLIFYISPPQSSQSNRSVHLRGARGPGPGCGSGIRGMGDPPRSTLDRFFNPGSRHSLQNTHASTAEPLWSGPLPWATVYPSSQVWLPSGQVSLTSQVVRANFQCSPNTLPTQRLSRSS